MNDDQKRVAHLLDIQNAETVRKRLAKLMALRCFRNTKLEDLHAGVFPGSKVGDYSDVKIVSPFGEIEWPRLARFDDDEMRALMIDVVNCCDRFIQELLDPVSGAAMVERLKMRDELPRWNDPE